MLPYEKYYPFLARTEVQSKPQNKKRTFSIVPVRLITTLCEINSPEKQRARELFISTISREFSWLQIQILRGEILLKTNNKGFFIIGALAVLAIVLFIIILIAAYDPAVKQTILDFLHAIFG